MIEIRIHGRGGQGAVTSAEMLALAAIATGKHAQAFPSFGPERRGAPVQAFVRISDRYIRMRGEIKEPDVVVVLDSRLLNIIDVSSGLRDKGILVVNTKRPAAEIKARFQNKWTTAVVDATAIALETIGVNIVNTTMLGAFVKACDIVTLESLEEPLRERFGKRFEVNFEACRKAYDKTVIDRSGDGKDKDAFSSDISSMPKTDTGINWQDIEIGAVIRTPGNAAEYRTGDWRSDRPILDRDKCIKCGLCHLFCPEGCISYNSSGGDNSGHFEIDLYYCKGCGICARECRPQAISMIPEEV